MLHMIRNTGPALLLCGVLLLPGCAAAAGAAAGAGAATYVNDQTVTSTVDAPVSDVATWTRAAFDDLGIEVSKTETESDGMELSGTHDDLDVHADIEGDGDATKIAVTAKRNTVDYDKDYAQKVLAQILSHQG